jgi:hypothetical protein
LSDLRLIAPPPRAELLDHLRPRLGLLVPGGRVIAEGILGADAAIDFVVVDPAGALVLVLVGAHDEDLELVGLALAQRAWVAARRRDWLQLAPELGLRTDAAVRTVVLCPAFGPTSRAAVEALGRDVMAAAQYRCAQIGADVAVLLEHVDFDRPEPAADEAPVRAVPPAPHAPRPAPRPAPEFRTGLSDADLGLTPEERLEFE